MKFFMFLIIFLLIGAFFIISSENIRLNNSENINLFFKEYASWIDGLFKNGKTIAGFVIKMEWLPDSGEINSEK